MTTVADWPRLGASDDDWLYEGAAADWLLKSASADLFDRTAADWPLISVEVDRSIEDTAADSFPLTSIVKKYVVGILTLYKIIFIQKC